MKAENYRKKNEQDLVQNYSILRQLLSKDQLYKLKYQEIMYIILGGNIQVSKISYFRKKKYRDEEPNLIESTLIKDGLDIKKQIVAKAWRFQKTMQRSKTIDVNKNQHVKAPSKQQTDPQQPNKQKNQPQKNNQDDNKEKQISKSPSKLRETRSKTVDEQRIKRKIQIMQIQESLTNLQAKLNTAKNEEQAAEYQKQYNKNFKQLTFLRNKRRMEREQNIIKRINMENSKLMPKKIDEIVKQINEIKQKNAKLLDKLPKYQQKLSKSEQILRLNSIFKYYSKKQAQSTNKYFSDMEKQINKLKLQTFIKFAQEFQLNRIVSIQEISSIFKSHSKGKRYIVSSQFFEVLSDIHNLECIKEERPINNQSLSQYFQEYIVQDSKFNKIVMNLRQPQNKEVRYKFKPKSHSGKYLKDIQQQLQERKKTLQYLAGPKNNARYNLLQKNKSRNNTAQNSRLFTNADQGLQDIYNPSVNFNDSVNSYSFRFKLKNTKNRVKTEGIIKSIQNTQEMIRKRQSENQMKYMEYKQKGGIEKPHEKIKHQNQQEEQLLANYDETKDRGNKNADNSKKKKQFEGFQDLIEESQQDEYLNKHLLPPIRQNRPANKIHF